MIHPEPRGLYRLPEGSWCQAYEGFHVILRAGGHLEVTVIQGPPPPGEAAVEGHAELPAGYELSLSGNKKGFLLKRLSSDRSSLAAGIDEYTAETDGSGSITRLAESGTLNAGHIWGTGERFHAVDQKNSASSGAVVGFGVVGDGFTPSSLIFAGGAAVALLTFIVLFFIHRESRH